jgi:hypothetical protein
MRGLASAIDPDRTFALDRFVGGEQLDAAPGHVGTTYGNLLSLRCWHSLRNFGRRLNVSAATVLKALVAG